MGRGSGKSSLAEEIYQKAQADNQEIIHLSQKALPQIYDPHL